MNLLTIPSAILGILGLAAIAGAASAWYRKSQGENQIQAGQNIIDLQKDENALQARKIISLQSQLDTANDVIERLTKDGKSNRTRKEK